MKSKFIYVLLYAIIYTAVTANGQKPVYPKPNGIDQVPFGKKLPFPNFVSPNKSFTATSYLQKTRELYTTTFDTVTKQFKSYTPARITSQAPSGLLSPANATQLLNAPKPPSANFHLTKDINSLAQSYPANTPDNAQGEFAVLNNISFFSATDGRDGRELWRSDGTAAGTYLVKDIVPGSTGSDVKGIIAANGLLYFSAYTTDNGYEPWVSDGTEAGTHLLKDCIPGVDGSFPNQFVNANGTVFFIVSTFYGTNNELWKTDGTEAGTSMVLDLQFSGQGYGNMFELTAVNNMAYFIAYTYYGGYQLFRSDGTDIGTYVVKQIGYNYGDNTAPMQLTSYNNMLYFSADDGFGRRLWVSDGTDAGTQYAIGFNDVFMQPDYLTITSNRPFLILNNVLFIAGYTYADGSGLYKYDASNTNGIVLVKDLTPGTDVDFVVPVDMRIVNDALYFKVINSTGDWHDELWVTKGDNSNTQLIKSFEPNKQTYFFYNANGTLYFVEHDSTYGDELWKSDGTNAGTVLVKDINTGPSSSYPIYLTFCSGKLLFAATDYNFGNELWKSDGTASGTSLVKDINSTFTDGSDAGFMYRGLSPFGNGVLFNAYTPQIGGELYKSDGTQTGTVLLNDIATGLDWSYPNDFMNKGKLSYFIGDDAIGTAIYQTDGTSSGLKRAIGYINRDNYYVVNFNVTDNGLVFYILGNKFTGAYELWRSDGMDAGSYVLNTNLYYNDYVITIGNTGYFVAGDYTNGFELWKSDGSLAGTKIVKDIYPGPNGSYPYSLFAYKNNLYFGAYDGFGLNNSLWKSDGSVKGTVRLKNITPAYFYENFADPSIPVYCISNSKLYFTATDYNTFGAELWSTNGTEAGTIMVKDINPYNNSFPNYLTDVNGTLFFTADDGVHGNELWLTNGTEKSTQMVKDAAPGFNSSFLYDLCSAGGKLFFLNDATYPNTLWSSDGTAANTSQVTDAGLIGLSSIKHLTPSGNKLFFGAYSLQFGTELYEGDANATNLGVTAVTSPAALSISSKVNETLGAVLYPNPALSYASVQLTGNVDNVSVSLTDVSGKIVWQKRFNKQYHVLLPIEKISAGVYTITVKNGLEIKTMRLVKE